jgi:hypothetical protein
VVFYRGTERFGVNKPIAVRPHFDAVDASERLKKSGGYTF